SVAYAARRLGCREVRRQRLDVSRREAEGGEPGPRLVFLHVDILVLGGVRSPRQAPIERRVMPGDGKDVLQALADAVNARDYDRLGELLSDDVEFGDMAAGQTVRGREATLGVIRMWLSAFPDMTLET